MQPGPSGEGGMLLSLSLFSASTVSPSPSPSLLRSPLTPHGAAGGTGCGGSGRRASPVESGSFRVACGFRSGPFCRNPVTRTACGQPAWRPLCRGPRQRSCCAQRTPGHGGPGPLQSPCRGSGSPPTCAAAPRRYPLRDPEPPQCPLCAPPGSPPRNRSLTEQNKGSHI